MSTTLAQPLRKRTTDVRETHSGLSEMQRRQFAQLPEGMQKRITVHPISECWSWRGARNSSGYGSVTNGRGGSMLAHRKAYMTLVGPIDGDLTVDHLCHNKLCMNVAHMEIVTRGENSSRKIRGRNPHWVYPEQKVPTGPSMSEILDRYFGHLFPEPTPPITASRPRLAGDAVDPLLRPHQLNTQPRMKEQTP